jgi:hypothetical protein
MKLLILRATIRVVKQLLMYLTKLQLELTHDSDQQDETMVKSGYSTIENFIDNLPYHINDIYARSLTMRCANYCKENSVSVFVVRNGRYRGPINAYPISVIEHLFATGDYIN